MTFCATAAPVRKRAAVIADRYRKNVRIVEAINEARRKTALGKITEVENGDGWGRSLNWVCASGEAVEWPERSGYNRPPVEALTAQSLPTVPAAKPPAAGDELMGLGVKTFEPAGGED